MTFSNTENDEKKGSVPFFVSKNTKYWVSARFSILSKAALLLNFHQIFPNDDLSIEMSSGPLYPYLFESIEIVAFYENAME